MVYDYLIASENVSFSEDRMIFGFSFFVSLFQYYLIYLHKQRNPFKMLLFFQLSRLFSIDQFSYTLIFVSIIYRRLIFVRFFFIRSFFVDPIQTPIS